jgi:hypothetical protein
VDFLVVQPRQTFLLAAQVEEQFALGLGGSHLDDAPVTQDEFVSSVRNIRVYRELSFYRRSAFLY